MRYGPAAVVLPTSDGRFDQYTKLNFYGYPDPGPVDAYTTA